MDYQETTQELLTDLRLGITNFDTMNPLLSKNKNIQFYDKLIFEPLLSVEQDFSLSSCLATEYSKTGDSSYIVKLRKDVVWQNGQSFTAKDVKYTVELLKSGLDSIYTSNVQDISFVSEQLCALGKRGGLNHKQAMRFGLAVEEMTVYTSNHINKQFPIDILVRLYDDRLEINFRSSGNSFSPLSETDNDDTLNLQLLRALAVSLDLHFSC